MTIQTDAVYEHGVLRPLAPLDLKEHEVVSLYISTAKAASSDDESARQLAILRTYVAKIESRPDITPQDGLTNRDHDRLIYGE